jgi:secreted trypsin-like serine protease
MNLHRRMTAVVAVAVLVALLPADPASAIAYGKDVADGAYRFSVRLTMTGLPADGGGTRDSWCSGALIASRWVITAGHCFRDGDGERVGRTVARSTTATVGRTDLRSRTGQQAEVVAVHQAENADVALAELGAAVTGIEPLRVGSSPPAAGEVVRLTGYGLTDGAESATTDRLQTGRFTVGRVGAAQIETSGRAPREQTSPCPHDSGGPYFRERPDGTAELVAVVSSGPRCPHPGPDVSARTDILADWIAGTVASDADPPGWLPAGIGAGALILLLTALLPVLRRRPAVNDKNAGVRR